MNAYSKEIEEQRFRRQVLFNCWFSTEAAEQNHNISVLCAGNTSDKKEKLKKQLSRILDAAGLSNDYDSWLSDCLPFTGANIRDDAFIVDRNQIFRDTYSQYEVNDSAVYCELERWLGTDGVFGSKSETDKSAAGRISTSFLSEFYGFRKKCDRKKIGENLFKVSNAIREKLQTINTPNILFSTLIHALGGDPENTNNFRKLYNLFGWGTGKASAAKLHLTGVLKLKEINVDVLEKLISVFEDEGRSSLVKAKQPKLPPAMLNAVREKLETSIGTPYRYINENGKGFDHTTPFSSIISHAAARFSASHSTMKNRIQELATFRGKIKDEHAFSDDTIECFSVLIDEMTTLFPGKDEKYVIHPRELRKWKNVTASWETVKNTNDRINCIKELQALFVEKFGHPALFFELAEEQYFPLWKVNGATDPNILFSLVEHAANIYRVSKMKIPCTRHFSDNYPANPEFGSGKIPLVFHAPIRDGSGTVDLSVLVDGRFQEKAMTWHSGRIQRELFPRIGTNPIPVTKCGHLGKAAARAGQTTHVKPTLVNKKNEWAAKIIHTHAGWRLFLSVKLESIGPWERFLNENNLDSPDPHHLINKKEKRTGQGRLKLCNLPGLRTIGVYPTFSKGIVCSIWKSLTRESAENIALTNGQKLPGQSATHCILVTKFEGKTKNIILKRLSPYSNDKGLPNPAPWAILEKTVTLKLNGENNSFIRKASSEERKKIKDILSSSDVATGKLSMNRLSLSWYCLHMAKKIIERHKRHALIARDLSAAVSSTDKDDKKILTARALANWANATTSEVVLDKEARYRWFYFCRHTYIDWEIEDLEKNIKGKSFKTRDFLPLCPTIDTANKDYADFWKHYWEKTDEDVKQKVNLLCAFALGREKNVTTKSTMLRSRGCSLAAVALLKEIYNVKKSFFERIDPTGNRKIAKQGFCVKLLTQIHRLQKERIQLQSAMVASVALDSENNGENACHCAVVPELFLSQKDAERKQNRMASVSEMEGLFDSIENELSLFGVRTLRMNTIIPSKKIYLDGSFFLRFIKCKKSSIPDDVVRYLGFLTEKVKKNQPVSDIDRAIISICSSSIDHQKDFLIPWSGGKILIGENGSPVNKDFNISAWLATAPMLDPDWIRSWCFVEIDSKGLPSKQNATGSKAFKCFKVEPSKQTKQILWQTASGEWLPYTEAYRKAVEKILKKIFDF